MVTRFKRRFSQISCLLVISILSFVLLLSPACYLSSFFVHLSIWQPVLVVHSQHFKYTHVCLVMIEINWHQQVWQNAFQYLSLNIKISVYIYIKVWSVCKISKKYASFPFKKTQNEFCWKRILRSTFLSERLRRGRKEDSMCMNKNC